MQFPGISSLISSAALTLFILPTLYNVFERGRFSCAVQLSEPPSTKELSPA